MRFSLLTNNKQANKLRLRGLPGLAPQPPWLGLPIICFAGLPILSLSPYQVWGAIHWLHSLCFKIQLFILQIRAQVICQKHIMQ